MEITITKVGPHFSGTSPKTGKPYTLLKMTADDGVTYSCWPNEFKRWTGQPMPTEGSIYDVEADDPDAWGQRKITKLEIAFSGDEEGTTPDAQPAAARPAATALKIDAETIKQNYEDAFVWAERMLVRHCPHCTEAYFWGLVEKCTNTVFKSMMVHDALAVGPNDATPEQLTELDTLLKSEILPDEPKEIARTILMGKGKNMRNKAADLISESNRIIKSAEALEPPEDEAPITDGDIPFAWIVGLVAVGTIMSQVSPIL